MYYDSPLWQMLGTNTDNASAAFNALKACTGLSARDLAMEFESFGNDCEFGALQRKCGAEPLGLFRWSNPEPNVILRALETRFDRFGEKATIELDAQKPRREWIVVDPENRLRQHTFVFEGDQFEEAFKAKQFERFLFCRRKMLEDLEDGSKIFVIKSGQGRLGRNEVEPIWKAMRGIGDATLLWVVPGEPVGRVECLNDGLMRGNIDRLTVQPHAGQCSLAGWLAVLSGVWTLRGKLRLERLQAASEGAMATP